MSLVMKIEDMKQLLKRSLTDLKAAREELAELKARNVSLTAAVKEKYLWHKQSEEPAPKDKFVLYYGLSYGTSACFDIIRGSMVEPDSFWRPLPDAPEEEVKP